MCSAESALGVLRSLAGLLETGLLPLLDPGVAGQQAGLLQRRPVDVDVGRVQRAGDTELQRPGLAGHAAAVDARDHVVRVLEPGGHERLVDELLVHLVREVGVERLAVDRPVAGAGHQADAGDGLLAAAGGPRRVDHRDPGGFLLLRGRRALGAVGDRAVGLDRHLGVEVVGGIGVVLGHGVCSLRWLYWEIWVISNGLGCWAVCGCSGPAYTLSFLSICRLRRFFGSMPQTAFSTTLRGSASRMSPTAVAVRPPG